MDSKQFQATLADIKQRITHSLALHKEMPAIGDGLIAMLSVGAIDSKTEAETVLAIIERRNLEGCLEPLWRALKYKLSGNEVYKMANSITQEVMDDVLKLLTFEEEH